MDEARFRISYINILLKKLEVLDDKLIGSNDDFNLNMISSVEITSKDS